MTIAQPGFARYAEASGTAASASNATRSTLPPEVASEIDDLVAAGQKIQSIRAYRTSRQVSLQEAKNAIDAWAPRGTVR